MAPLRTRELPPLDEDALDAWVGFLRTHAVLVRELDVELQAAHDLSLTQYEVLLLLARSDNGSLRLSDLAHGALLSLSGLSRLVDRLASMGLVERAQCPDDRRSSLACLTAAGRRRFREARPTHLDGVRRLFIDRLPEGAVAEFNRAWAALAGDPA